MNFNLKYLNIIIKSKTYLYRQNTASQRYYIAQHMIRVDQQCESM
jgi:hypothetical protein